MCNHYSIRFYSSSSSSLSSPIFIQENGSLRITAQADDGDGLWTGLTVQPLTIKVQHRLRKDTKSMLHIIPRATTEVNQQMNEVKRQGEEGCKQTGEETGKQRPKAPRDLA